MVRRVQQKKNSRVSPCFYVKIFFKTALIVDLKQWSSRRYRRRYRYRCRHRRGGSSVEKS
jgi:hypothetical protein